MRKRAIIGMALLILAATSRAVPPNPALWERSESLRELYAQNPPDPVRANAHRQPDGIEYVLTLRVDFSDKPGVRPRAQLDQWVFDPNVASITSYYAEASYGQMEVRPGVGDGSYPNDNAWYRMPKTMAYYGDGRINVPLYRELVRDACAAADGDVNFADYDRDRDGYVDHLVILHAGGDEASSAVPEDIWSILVPDIAGRWDGTAVAAAMVFAEEPDTATPHLGVWFHEFFHDFGSPESYVNGTLVSEHDHQYGLMGLFGPYQGGGSDRNGTQPSHICGYLKWDFDGNPENGRNGWITPVELDTNTIGMTIPAFSMPDGLPPLYKIDIPGKDGKEFFLIENRSGKAGALFDTALPDNGLLIWHVDEAVPRSALSVAPRMWLEDPSDPRHFDLSLTITQDAAYSKEDGQTDFSISTNPNSNANDGTSSGVSILNVSESGPTMTYDLFLGDTYEPNGSISEAYPIPFDRVHDSFLWDDLDLADYYGVAAGAGDRIRIQVVFDGSQQAEVSLVDALGVKLADASRFVDTAVDRTRYEILFFAARTETIFVHIAPTIQVSTALAYAITASRDAETATAPPRFTSLRVFPNPVRPGDAVKFGMSFEKAGVDRLSAEVYTTDGRRVGIVEQGQLATGSATLEFGTSDGSRVMAPGVYFVLITAESGDQLTKRLAKFAVE